MAILIKSHKEIELMRQAGRIVAQTLALLSEHVKPGVTTGELDKMAYEFIKSQGAIPSFKGYHPFPDIQPFPGTICASVNEEIVHGIPGGRVLKEGDIIALDCGAIYRGWQGDSATTVGVGKISPELKAPLKPQRPLWRLASPRQNAGITSATYRTPSNNEYSRAASTVSCASTAGTAWGAGYGKSLLSPTTAHATGSSFGLGMVSQSSRC